LEGRTFCYGLVLGTATHKGKHGEQEKSYGGIEFDGSCCLGFGVPIIALTPEDQY